MTRHLTLHDLAERWSVSYDRVQKQWPSFLQYGVHPMRRFGEPENAPLFRETEILAMEKQWEAKVSPTISRLGTLIS